VALSEQEQRALEALERGLSEQDPDFVSRVSAQSASINAHFRIAASVVGIVVGLALMLAFCLSTAVIVGVVGFLVMFASLYSWWVNVALLRRAGEPAGDLTGGNRSRRMWRPWRAR